MIGSLFLVMGEIDLINISFLVGLIKEYKPQRREDLKSFTKEDFDYLVKMASEIDEKYNPCSSSLFLF